MRKKKHVRIANGIEHLLPHTRTFLCSKMCCFCVKYANTSPAIYLDTGFRVQFEWTLDKHKATRVSTNEYKYDAHVLHFVRLRPFDVRSACLPKTHSIVHIWLFI